MWFQMLPSTAVFGGLLLATSAAPSIVSWVFRRDRKYTPRYFHGHDVDYQMYVRDIYQFGSLYNPQGLEALDNVQE